MFSYFFGCLPCRERQKTINAPPLIETEELAVLDPALYRVVETGMRRDEYDAGHIAGSVFWPVSELTTLDFRLRTDPAHFADLLSRSGITPQTWVVCSFAGDKAGWGAWLFWILTGFGHARTRVLNGGTHKWQAEKRPLCTENTVPKPAVYPTPAGFADTERAMLRDVRDALQTPAFSAPLLLDARSETEYNGAFLDAPPRENERAGRIPGAVHFGYADLLRPDNTYKTADEIAHLCQTRGLLAGRPIITYCAVGIRSALLWFGLRHLLGLPRVRNFDGSWNEWSRTETIV